jgi:hypothetical protein
VPLGTDPVGLAAQDQEGLGKPRQREYRRKRQQSPARRTEGTDLQTRPSGSSRVAARSCASVPARTEAHDRAATREEPDGLVWRSVPSVRRAGRLLALADGILAAAPFSEASLILRGQT